MYYQNVKSEELEVKPMDANEKETEMVNEEVNIYTTDCGEIRLKCVTDCFFVLPFLSTEE